MNIEVIELTDWIRPLALIVSFCILVAFDRKVWMSGEAIIVAGFGAGLLLFPASMLAYEVEGDLDALHLKLARLYGATMVCSTLLFYLTRDTRDGTVPISIMTAKVFEAGIRMLSFVYSYNFARKTDKAAKWNHQLMYSGLVGVVLLLLGHLYHLIRSADFSTYPQYNVRINAHLRVDAFLTLLGALVFLAFPDAAIRSLLDATRLDQVHTHLSRDIGIQLLASSLVAIQAGGFLHEHDKRHHFLVRIVTCLSMVALFGAFELQGGAELNRKRWGRVALLLAAPLLNAAAGFCAETTMFYRAKSKRE